MAISVNYQKRKNTNIFHKFQTNNKINLSNIQNYIPIYDRFFSLNNTNWDAINLNHVWAIHDIIENDKNNNEPRENIFYCRLKGTSDKDINDRARKHVFIKMAPLLDPYKYLVGKYNHNDEQLFNLPSLDKTNKVHPKISEPNNSSFIDGFFSFLTSKAMHEHGFIHGLDYYGSFLAIKNNYKINIIDDLDYLVQSEFFNKQKGVLFNVEDYSHLIANDEVKPLQPLKISTSLKSALSVKSLDTDLFENIFSDENQNQSFTLNDIKNIGIDLEDITESCQFNVSNSSQHVSDTLKSGSTCSSRTSHTNDNDLDDIEDIDEDIYDTSISKSSYSSENNEDDNTVWEDIEDIETDDYDDDTISEETIMVTLPKFPVQVICMEACENTFDSLIIREELNEEEWFSALMQIIMTLISYQKMFWFTHNDLHTNNIMYIPTNKKFIYYTYKKKIYKVPTYGKIYKIIDFGRAIYKFNGKLFCSDSFQPGGDAATQYNTEPYYNEKKPRLEPNFSFDLCRLACSIFDYVVTDFDAIMLKNIHECPPLMKLIVEWCIDDNGINVLYKNNGVERYPDFKLYKMISRCVHNHTPAAQLERKEFSKFIVSDKKSIPNITGIEHFVINIDELPSYI